MGVMILWSAARCDLWPVLIGRIGSDRSDFADMPRSSFNRTWFYDQGQHTGTDRLRSHLEIHINQKIWKDGKFDILIMLLRLIKKLWLSSILSSPPWGRGQRLWTSSYVPLTFPRFCSSLQAVNIIWRLLLWLFWESRRGMAVESETFLCLHYFISLHLSRCMYSTCNYISNNRSKLSFMKFFKHF